MIEVFYDGSCGPENPGGIMGVGAVFYREGEKIHEISEFFHANPSNSSNRAEYQAIVSSLTYLLSQNLEKEIINFYGDSRLTVMQMSGKWKPKQGLYLETFKAAQSLAKKFKHLCFNWIPREDNDEADFLSRVDGEEWTVYKRCSGDMPNL